VPKKIVGLRGVARALGLIKLMLRPLVRVLDEILRMMFGAVEKSPIVFHYFFLQHGRGGNTIP